MWGQTVTLNPTALTFTTPTGTISAPQTVTVTNSGSAPLFINTIQVLGGGFDYTSDCLTGGVAPGKNCTITVTFQAFGPGETDGTITIGDNATPNQQTVALTGNGAVTGEAGFIPLSLTFSQTVGTTSPPQTITFTNIGLGPLTIISTSLSGDGFNYTTTCVPGPLQPDQQCTFSVTFMASSTATVQGSITINDDASPGTQTIPLSGSGVPPTAPGLSLSPAAIAFAPTVLGTSHLQPIQFTNSGTAPLIISAAGIGGDPADYSIDQSCVKTLAPGESCTANVSFHPGSAGSLLSAPVTVISNAASNPSAALTGQGIGPGQCPDADGDGLCDDWETNGYYARVNGADVFVNLPAMGADPRHKDIFVHADYMQTSDSVADAHTHKPNPLTLFVVQAVFGAGPVSNPDNAAGVRLHIDSGPDSIMNPVTGATWGILSQAARLNEITPFANTPPGAPYDWSPFDAQSTVFNASGRRFAFHHCMFVHDLQPGAISGVTSTVSGVSRGAPESDFIVSLGSWGPFGDSSVSGTFMHELGHNLGLQHGGADSINYKPNYLSVMNYTYQVWGLPTTGAGEDYSRFSLPDLNEANLNETVGLNGGTQVNAFGASWFCPGFSQATSAPQISVGDNGAIDWNCNTQLESKVSADINGDGSISVLSSQNDWAKLIYIGGAIGAYGVSTPPAAVVELTAEQAALQHPTYGFTVQAPSIVTLAPGASATVTMVVKNAGLSADTYSLSAGSYPGWLDAGSLPGTLSIPAGGSSPIQVTLSAPASSKPGDVQPVVITAQSQSGAKMTGTAQMFVTVSSTPNPITLSVGSLNLGSVTLGGGDGETSPVLVTNTGATALAFSSITVSGDFTETNNCGTSLAAGESCVIQITFVPTASGARTGVVTINAGDAGSPHMVSLQGTAIDTATAPVIGAFVNAASSLPGALAPGSIFALYGLNLASGTGTAVSLPLPTKLGGTTITVNGINAALLYAGAGQINGQIPFELQTGNAVAMVTNSNGVTATTTLQISAVSPGLFLNSATHLAAQNQDYTVNSASKPATPKEAIIVYFTGPGALDQPIATGQPSPSSPVANVAAKTTATIGGAAATVLFSGMTPGTAGLAQANITVPATKAGGSAWTAGDYPVVLTVGGVASNAGNISIAPAK